MFMSVVVMIYAPNKMQLLISGDLGLFCFLSVGTHFASCFDKEAKSALWLMSNGAPSDCSHISDPAVLGVRQVGISGGHNVVMALVFR